MIKKFLISILVFCMSFINLYSIRCYATTVPVTDENLTTALEGFVSSASNENNYEITVKDNVITMNLDDVSYTLTYDLTNNPTFSYTVDIQQGMSYTDFKEKTEALSSIMIGYIAVANVQGVDYEDSGAYIAMNLLQAAFSGLSSANTNDSYIIYDDTDLSDGVTIEKDPNDTKTIYASEFGDHVMEYVNSIYGEKASYKDTEGLNTYEWTTEKQDATDTSCKIVSTITVNLDADFSKLKGYSSTVEDSFSDITDTLINSDKTEQDEDFSIKDNSTKTDNSKTDENKVDTANIKKTATNASKDDSTIFAGILPKTGVSQRLIIIGFFISMFFAIIFAIINTKYKDIK